MTANEQHPKVLGEKGASNVIEELGILQAVSQALDLAANGEIEEYEDAQYAIGFLERVLVACSGSQRDLATGEIVSTGYRVVDADAAAGEPIIEEITDPATVAAIEEIMREAEGS